MKIAGVCPRCGGVSLAEWLDGNTTCGPTHHACECFQRQLHAAQEERDRAREAMSSYRTLMARRKAELDAAQEALAGAKGHMSNLARDVVAVSKERDEARRHWSRCERGWNRVILRAEGFQRDYMTAIERGVCAINYLEAYSVGAGRETRAPGGLGRVGN